jgi:hypothetical protein
MALRSHQPEPLFLCEYAVPRGGRTVRVAVRSRDGLRVLRTELELLRRLRRRLRSPHIAGAAGGHRYSTHDRRELARILVDANSELVAAGIERIDSDFPGLREELVISVIEDYANGIAREIRDAGLLAPAPLPAPSPPPIEAVLRCVEAELAKLKRSVANDGPPAITAP